MSLRLSYQFESALAEHRWINPQGDSTCTCGWECSPGEIREAAHRRHLAKVLCHVVVEKMELT